MNGFSPPLLLWNLVRIHRVGGRAHFLVWDSRFFTLTPFALNPVHSRRALSVVSILPGIHLVSSHPASWVIFSLCAFLLQQDHKHSKGRHHPTFPFSPKLIDRCLNHGGAQTLPISCNVRHATLGFPGSSNSCLGGCRADCLGSF